MGCADQCPGGMGCLMAFVLCTWITIFFQALSLGQHLLGGSRGDYFCCSARWHCQATLVLSMATCCAQVWGACYGWEAFKLAREVADGGTSESAVQMSDIMRPSSSGEQPRRGSTFTAFSGSGQRLGS